ncbi:MAG: transposase [Nitrospira sp.]|nr:transposase [Nitrospira sp.]
MGIGSGKPRFRRGTACRAPTEQFGCPVTGSIPTIIRSFKSAVTKQINEQRRTPGVPIWQRNYYEHIIRNDESLNRIREYIANNPLQWALDRENPDFVRARHAVPQPKDQPKDEPWRI